MPGKIANTLSHEQLVQMLDELRALSAKPTLAQIQAVAAKYGVDVSLEGAKTFRKSTWEDHLARLAAGREKAQGILNQIRGDTAHALDAVEEAAAIDLLDQYTSGEEVDVAQVVKIAMTLRSSIEQRKDRERNDRDLERKLKETDAKLELADKQAKLRDQQIRDLEAKAAEREEKNRKAKAALESAKKKGGLTKDTLAQIEEAAGLL